MVLNIRRAVPGHVEPFVGTVDAEYNPRPLRVVRILRFQNVVLKIDIIDAVDGRICRRCERINAVRIGGRNRTSHHAPFRLRFRTFVKVGLIRVRRV